MPPPRVSRRRIERGWFERTFLERTQAMYSGMIDREARLAKRQGRPARPMPFSLAELRDAVLDQLGGLYEGCRQCNYCNAVINIKTITLDHADPIAPPWNGSLGFENLVACCQTCNTRKGRMSARGWIALVEFITAKLDPRDATNVLERLANGGGYRPLQFRHRELQKKLAAPAAAVPSPQHTLL